MEAIWVYCAEFATKTNVVSTQDDASKLVYSFLESRVEALTQEMRVYEGGGAQK